MIIVIKIGRLIARVINIPLVNNEISSFNMRWQAMCNQLNRGYSFSDTASVTVFGEDGFKISQKRIKDSRSIE